MSPPGPPKCTRRRALGLFGTGVLPRRSDRQTWSSTQQSGTSRHATVGFVGDVMLARGVESAHRSEPATVWGDLRPRLRSLDAFCLNLECCLSDRGQRRPDREFYFRADPDWALPVLEEADVTFASLANNHVLDYGEEALVDTLRSLDRADVHHAGAGRDLEAARRPATFTAGDVDVTVLSLTDNAPSYAATTGEAGTWYVDVGSEPGRERVRETLSAVRDETSGLLVASVHWGPNWVTEPATGLRRFAHLLVDEGVDLVHGHSAHVFQGVEQYEDGLVLHDCADFVDDYVVKNELHNDRSFLFELDVSQSGMDALRLIPVEIEAGAVTKADERAATWARDAMRGRSRAFGTTFTEDDGALRLDVSG